MTYLKDTYRKMAEVLAPDEDYFELDSRFYVLEQILRSLPQGKLCDFGCGRGLLLRRVSAYHATFGTEFDESAVALCREAGLAVEHIDLNEDENLPFANERFDIVVISEVCEHLLAPRNALRLAKKYLKSNGTLIVTVPNAIPLFARWRLLLGQTVDWLHFPSRDTEITGHIRFYTLESMSRLLKEEGFVVENSRGVSFRMNGKFWERLCYWLPRLVADKERSAPTKVDARLGEMFPGISPGLLFICKSASLRPLEKSPPQ